MNGRLAAAVRALQPRALRARRWTCYLLSGVLLWAALGATRPRESRGVPLALVLFAQNGFYYVIDSRLVSRRIEIPVVNAARDSHMTLYSAEAAVNEVLAVLNSPHDDGDDSEIAIWSPRESPGGTWRYLTDNDDDDWQPRWVDFPGTEDPRKPRPIVFVSDRDGDADIYLLPRDGSGVKQLTNDPATDEQPVVAKGKIYFVSDRDGDADVYVMRTDGGGVTNLTNNDVLDTQPDPSPDGERIVFTSELDHGQNIFVMDADGSNLAQLTDRATEDRDPVWGPDGSVIYFTSGRDGSLDVYEMTPEGQITRQMTDENIAQYVVDATFEPPPHERTLTLKLSGHLTASGKAGDVFDLFKGCIRKVLVRIHRRTADGWRLVKRTRTGALGSFETGLPDVPGRYRASVQRLRPATPLSDVRCRVARATPRHRHG